MSKDQPHIDYFELISSYLSGNASDEEVSLLEEWVTTSPDNKAHFQAYKKAWILSGMQKNQEKTEVEKEWLAIKNQLFSEGKIVKMPAKKRQKNSNLWRLAAAVAALVVVSIGWYLTSADTSVQLAAQSEIQENQLPDGSNISLNQYSSLAYDTDFGGIERRVKLIGDAFFEVEKNPKKPFVIVADDIEVKVLGTSFYIDSRPDEPEVQVMVASGLVAVTAGNKKVELKAGEMAVFSKVSGQLLKKIKADNNYLAWKTNKLIFEDASFEQVIFSLNRNFHSSIKLSNPALKNCKITATYQNKTLQNIIRIIEKTLAIKANIGDEEIVFTGDACE